MLRKIVDYKEQTFKKAEEYLIKENIINNEVNIYLDDDLEKIIDDLFNKKIKLLKENNYNKITIVNENLRK